MSDSWLQPVYFDFHGRIVRPQWIVVWEKYTGKRATRDTWKRPGLKGEGFLVCGRNTHFIGRAVLPDGEETASPHDKLYILHWSEDIILKMARQVLRDAREGNFLDEIGPIHLFKGSDTDGQLIESTNGELVDEFAGDVSESGS